MKNLTREKILFQGYYFYDAKSLRLYFPWGGVYKFPFLYFDKLPFSFSITLHDHHIFTIIITPETVIFVSLQIPQVFFTLKSTDL